MFGYRLIRKRELGRLRAYEAAYIEKSNTARLYEDEIILLKKELEELRKFKEKHTPERGAGGKFMEKESIKKDSRKFNYEDFKQKIAQGQAPATTGMTFTEEQASEIHILLMIHYKGGGARRDNYFDFAIAARVAK